MKKPNSIFVCSALIFQMIFSSPLPGVQNVGLAPVYADTDSDHSTVCDPIKDRQNSRTDKSLDVPGYQDCSVADIAKKGKVQATIKSVIFGAGAVACGILAFFDPGIACVAISTSLTLLGAAYDNFIKEKVAEQTQMLSDKLQRGFSALAGALVTGAYKMLGDKITAWISSTTGFGGGAAKASCWTSVIILGSFSVLAIMEHHDLKKVQSAKVEDARNAVFASDSTKKIEGTFQAYSNGPNSAPVNPRVGSATQDQGDPETSCASAQGNAYITCAFAGGPLASASSALVSDPKLNGLIGKLTGGKTLGDLAKSFKGEPSLEGVLNHAATAFGLPPGFGGKLAKELKSTESLVQKYRGSDSGAVYASKGSKSSSSEKSGDLDFNKMMEGMLKQLNPDGEKAPVAGKDASEAVFRRLDLLPADKIEGNKDISLFVRIGYRYRKKLPGILDDLPEAQSTTPVKNPSR